MRRPHDIFFKSVFQDPKRTTALLRAAAKKNPSLQEFINVINLDTLQEIPAAYAESGETGAADLAFTVSIRENDSSIAGERRKDAKLLVGIIEEHKSSPDKNVIQQLVKYWYKLMFRKMQNIPTVAIVIYNGTSSWKSFEKAMFPDYPAYFHKIGLPFICEFINVGSSFDTEKLASFDPQTAIAIVAMKYAFDGTALEAHFVPALRAFLEANKGTNTTLVEEIMVYLKSSLKKEDKEHFMDLISTKEAYGYETIADAEYADGLNDGLSQGKTEGELRKAREMAKAMLADGIPVKRIATYSGLSEADILAL